MAAKKNKGKVKTVTRGQLRPPSGSYDPILNAQGRSANRGYGDLKHDIATQRERGKEDYDSDVSSLTLGRDRSLADILTGETRAGEDKDTALANLDLQYNRLGQRQNESARVSGVTSGGLLAKSAAVRDANEVRDQQPIMTSFNRAMQDYGTARTRIGEDYTTQKGLLDRGYDRTYGDTGDLTTQLTRAGRENTFFQQDLDEQRAYQAAPSGWKAPNFDRPGTYVSTSVGMSRVGPAKGGRGVTKPKRAGDLIRKYMGLA